MKHAHAIHAIPPALALLAALALPACKPAVPEDPAVPPPASVNSFSAVNLVSEFPGAIDAASYAGHPLLVVFFLPDDPPCAASVPDWNAISRDYAPRANLLALVPDPRPADVLSRLVRPLAPEFPVGQADSSIVAAFGSPSALRVVPTAFLLDASGAVCRFYPGHTLPKYFREDLDALLANLPLPDHTPPHLRPPEEPEDPEPEEPSADADSP